MDITIGLPSETVLALVSAELERRGFSVKELRFSADGVHGTLGLPDTPHPISTVPAVFDTTPVQGLTLQNPAPSAAPAGPRSKPLTVTDLLDPSKSPSPEEKAQSDAEALEELAQAARELAGVR